MPSPLVEPIVLGARVLAEHPEAPEVCGVDVRATIDGPLVSLHIRCAWPRTAEDTVSCVAQWAVALGSSVLVEVHSDHVRIWASAVIDGCTVEAWNHLTVPQLVQLLPGLPGEGEQAAFEPAALLSVAASLAAA